MSVQVPARLMVLILVVLVGGLWFALMRAVIIPALNWLFGRVDRVLRRRLGIPEGEDDSSE